MANEIDWNWWLDKSTVKEWEACALSLGINPEFIIRQVNPINPHQVAFLLDADRFSATNEQIEQFKKRIELIQNNKYSSNFYLHFDEIYLMKFVDWALTTRTFKEFMPEELILFGSNSKGQVDEKLKEAAKAPVANKHTPVQQKQDEAVLQAIRDLKHDPLALPPQLKEGVGTIKAKVREHVRLNPILDTADKFNNTWKRLKQYGDIKVSK
jgi:hypothetical protein